MRIYEIISVFKKQLESINLPADLKQAYESSIMILQSAQNEEDDRK